MLSLFRARNAYRNAIFRFNSTAPITVDSNDTRRTYLNATTVVTSCSTAGHNLPSFGFGDLGHMTDSSVVSYQQETVVHAAISTKCKYSVDDGFLPLTVDYRDRLYARGIIPVRSSDLREKHSSDDETLVSRMIDRAIRPLFPSGYVDELQVLVTTHAADGKNDPTVLGMNAASCALLLSSAPWNGPIGCVRIGKIDGVLKVNPTVTEMKTSTLDLVYAGTAERPVMLEASADEIPENEMIEAMQLAHSSIQPIIKSQIDLKKYHTDIKQDERKLIDQAVAAAKLPALTSNGSASGEQPSRLLFSISPILLEKAEKNGLNSALQVFRASLPRSERSRREGAVRSALLRALHSDESLSGETPVAIKMAAEEVMNKAFRTVIFEGSRVDGRGQNELRKVTAAVDVLPTPHGSAIFTRGDTHVLCTTTLGSLTHAKENLLINGSTDETPKHFVLHYDFPPYCKGAVDSIKGNRRVIGHGVLAEKAMRPVLPSLDKFPYLVRVFSECTSSSGSSSMASVCGATLALMDAGVPIKRLVAGVSVGLVSKEHLSASSSNIPVLSGLVRKELQALAKQNGINATLKSAEIISRLEKLRASSTDNGWLLLTDILGMEDHYGDMDFKIAGTTNGITAIQLDVKLQNGVPLKALEEAIFVSKETRLKILNRMSEALSAPRENLKAHAPVAARINFDPERRRYLLGAGGEMMRYIQRTYECEMDISDEVEQADRHTVYLYGRNATLINRAKSLVQDLVLSIEVGEICTAVVSEIKDFGATVKISRSQEAMLHISDITNDPALRRTPVDKLIAVGQKFEVEILSVNKSTGQVKVSRRKLLQADQPDLLRPQPSDDSKLEGLPQFPVIPPRKWSREFFRDNVASPSVVAAATGVAPEQQKKQRNIFSPNNGNRTRNENVNDKKISEFSPNASVTAGEPLASKDSKLTQHSSSGNERHNDAENSEVIGNNNS